MPDENVTIQLDVEGQSQAEGGLRGMEKALSNLRKATEDLRAATANLANIQTSSNRVQDESASKVEKLSAKVAGGAAGHFAYAAATGHAKAEVAKLGGTLATLNAGLAKTTSALSTAASATARFASKALPLLKTGLAAIGVALGVKLLADLAQYVDRLGVAGAKTAASAGAFDNLAKSIGSTGDAMLGALSRGTAGAVSDLDLLKAGTFALSTELVHTTDRMEKVASVATRLGIMVGKTTADAFDRLTRGAILANIALIKPLGVVVDFEKAHRDFAASVGKSVKELTGHEKIEARLIQVLERGEAVLGRAGISTDNLAVASARAAASQKNLQTAIRQAVAESEEYQRVATDVRDIQALLNNVVAEAAKDTIPGLIDAIIDAAEASTRFVPGGRGFARALAAISEKAGDAARELRQAAIQADALESVLRRQSLQERLALQGFGEGEIEDKIGRAHV